MVNLHEIESFAKDLIKEHCPTYRFEWSRGTTVHGQCSYTRRVIKLSKPYALVATQDQIFNTITHEIAHAVVGSGHGHDFVWQNKHRQLGGNGKRCSTVSVPRAINYVLTCEGKCWTANYQRRPKLEGRICRRCRGKLISTVA